jgi:hypothetical protein
LRLRLELMPTTDQLAKSLIVQPPATAWLDRSRIARTRERIDAAWPRAFPTRVSLRRELGLLRDGEPDDLPIIMGGHQAEWWHGGILAKYLAAQAAAGAVRGVSAWVVVDQDESSPTTVRVPLRAVKDGQLQARVISLMGGEPPRSETASMPAALLGTLRVGGRVEYPAGLAPGHAAVEEGVAAMRDAMAAHVGAATAAEQAALATADVVRARLGGPPAGDPRLVYATMLLSTALGRAMVRMLCDDAPRAVSAYNDAVRAHPQARVSTLAVDAARGEHELPLWLLVPASSGVPARRERVTSTMLRELDDAATARLAPRALLLTALLRLAACDVFIHGTGGGASDSGDRTPAGYDRITEQWMRHWLGVELAPSVLVTATLCLPLELPPAPMLPKALDAASAEHAVRDMSSLAHRAKHDPALLHDVDVAARKRDVVRAIAAIPPRWKGGTAAQQAERRRLYDELQALLVDTRARHAAELAEIEASAAALAEYARQQSIAHDRTYSFPLHTTDALRSLAENIRAACVAS